MYVSKSHDDLDNPTETTRQSYEAAPLGSVKTLPRSSKLGNRATCVETAANKKIQVHQTASDYKKPF